MTLSLRRRGWCKGRDARGGGARLIGMVKRGKGRNVGFILVLYVLPFPSA